MSAWGAEVEWKEATILQTESAAQGMQRLMVMVGPEVLQGHALAGQFVQMKVGESKAAFLAIASPPGASSEGAMEFLIRAVPNSTADLLCNLNAGDKVSPSTGSDAPALNIVIAPSCVLRVLDSPTWSRPQSK